MVITVNGIDLTIPSNYEFYTNLMPDADADSYRIYGDVEFRPCVTGEGMTTDGACFECPKNTFMIEPPTEPTECIECPTTRAVCLGGGDVGPAPGYWR